MKYDVILFDSDGTLLDFHRSEREAVSEAFLQMGVSVNDEMIDEYSRINDSLWKKLERKEIEKHVLLYHRFELFFEKYGIDADAKEMARLYIEQLSTKGYLIDGATELCERLYGKAKLYIVTNGVAYIQKRRMDRCGLLPYFERSFISEEVGTEKPAVEYFEKVAENIDGFDKERAIIIGDSLTSDIKGGIGYGIDTCWYNPSKKTAPDDMREKITYDVENYDQIYNIIVG